MQAQLRGQLTDIRIEGDNAETVGPFDHACGIMCEYKLVGCLGKPSVVTPRGRDMFLQPKQSRSGESHVDTRGLRSYEPVELLSRISSSHRVSSETGPIETTMSTSGAVGRKCVAYIGTMVSNHRICGSGRKEFQFLQQVVNDDLPNVRVQTSLVVPFQCLLT